ncbi:hypothetical protein OC834_004935 [Tilletia horrida]|nr:hypothetical protein OC834_004935 [Tilletia horrida]
MWVVSGMFGKEPERATERVLGCGEAYNISRNSAGGRELQFDGSSISRFHAAISVEAAPAPEQQAAAGDGQAPPMRTLALDWRPRLTLSPGKDGKYPKTTRIKRVARTGTGAGAASDGGGEAADGNVTADEDEAPAALGGKRPNEVVIEVPAKETIELLDGDIVVVSARHNFEIKVKWVPLAFCVMPKARNAFKDLNAVADRAASVGIPIVVSQEWHPSATHLVLKRIALRPTILDAMFASAPLVRPDFVRAIVNAAVEAEVAPSEFTPERQTLDARLREYLPEMPQMEDDGDEQMRARLQDTFLKRARQRPLVGRTVLCFSREEAEDHDAVDANLMADVFKSLGAKVEIHSLTEKPLKDKKHALKVIKEAKARASRTVTLEGPVVRRHIGQDQQLIIWYMGDEATLPFVGGAANEAYETKLAMPPTIGGEIDWICYGVRTWESLLRPYTGIVQDYVDTVGATQLADAAEEEEAGPAEQARERQQPAAVAEQRAEGSRAQAEGSAAAEPQRPADGVGEQPAQNGGAAAAAAPDEDADRSAEVVSLRRMKQNAESRKRDMDAFFNDDDIAPPRPAARSKAAAKRAAEAEKAKEAAAAAAASAAGSGASTAKKPRRRGPGISLDELFDDMPGAGRSSSAGAGASKHPAEPESTMRQLRAAFEEEETRMTQAAASAAALQSVGTSGGQTAGVRSLITQAIREEMEMMEEDEEELRSQAQAPMTPLVDMEDSAAALESQGSRRKRTASPSPERDGDKTARTTKRRKRGNAAEEEVAPDQDASPAAEPDAGTQQPAAGAKRGTKARVVRGHKHKHSDKGPDKDEGFLRAVSTIEPRKKGDEFDKEFDQLRIAKPVYDQMGRRRARSEKEMGEDAGGGGGVKVVRGQGQEEEEQVDEEFLRFKEMAEEELDCGLRGNFMQVDFVPLVVQHAEVRPHRIEPDGRPNFKAFRRKGQAKPAFDPHRVVTTVLDALPQLQIGEDSIADLGLPKRTTYQGDEDEDLEEDDAEFTGLNPPPRTYSGHRARTANRFNFSLGDEDEQRSSGTQRDGGTVSSTAGGRRGARSQSTVPASGTRGKGRGARAGPQYVEVVDEEEEDSDPEASLLLNLDEEEGLDDEDGAPDTQFSLDSGAGTGRGGRGKKTAAAAAAKTTGGGGATGRTAKKSTRERMMEPVPMLPPRTGSKSKSKTASAGSNESSQLFRGVDDSLDPLAEQESVPLDPSPDLGAGPSASTSASASASGSLRSTMGPPGSVVPASRPMESHDEDTFMGFGASGRRKRATPSSTGAGTGPASSSRSTAAGRSRTRF